MLPGTDGFEVCRQVREKKDLPILFFILADVLATMVCGMITAMMIVLFTKTTPVETKKPKEDEDVEDKTE